MSTIVRLFRGYNKRDGGMKFKTIEIGLQVRKILVLLGVFLGVILGSNMFVFAINTSPILYLTTPNAAQSINASGVMTISGTVTDPDVSQTETISATVAGVLKSTITTTPALNATWSISWSGIELTEGNYPDDIIVTVSDGINSDMVTYTGNITVNNMAQAIGILGTPIALDRANYGDGRDLIVTFNGTYNETIINQYRIYVVPSASEATFNVISASRLSDLRYIAESKNGNYGVHTVTLTQRLQDTTGSPIINGVTYKIFVLTVGENGNVLSTGSREITLYGTIPQISTVSIIDAQDVSNGGNAGDIRVTFIGSSDETNISYYRVYVVPKSVEGSFRATTTNYNVNYQLESVGGVNSIHKINLSHTLLDSTGADIINGIPYKIFVQTVGMNTYLSNLSQASNEVVLYPMVPILDQLTAPEIANKIVEMVDVKESTVLDKAKDLSYYSTTINYEDYQKRVVGDVLEVTIDADVFESKIKCLEQLKEIIDEKLVSSTIKKSLMDNLTKISLKVKTSSKGFKAIIPISKLIKADKNIKLQINNLLLPVSALRSEEIEKAILQNIKPQIGIQVRNIKDNISGDTTLQMVEVKLELIKDRGRTELKTLNDKITIGVNVLQYLTPSQKQKLVIYTQEWNCIEGRYNSKTNLVEFRVKESGMYRIVKEK